jgi:hypothetical protein
VRSPALVPHSQMPMLLIPHVDIKTGQLLTETNAAGMTALKQKAIAHSYLEHWLNYHGIEQFQFWVGTFQSVKESYNAADRQRLEAEGKYLVFANGKNGYFTDAATAKLLTEGDAERDILPIFSNDRTSPHYSIAYGSLIASSGINSTAVDNAKILVIDDEQRSHGNDSLIDVQGQALSPVQVEKLYDKMGDGTLLISSRLMGQLIQPEERDAITQAVFEQAEISTDIASLTQDTAAVDAILPRIDRQLQQLSDRTVSQFRAATPDLPGMLKGTMSSSDWCDRLGIDAIISKSDIKGDSGILSEPGLKEVSNFWVNRKSDGQYSEQRVGAQLKGCIPEATLHEFNPQLKAQGESLAAVAADPQALLQYYVAQKDRYQVGRSVDLELGELAEEMIDPPPDWLHTIGQADRFSVLTGFNKINYELERFLRSERVDLALRGIYVPSAMAQHHSQLEPWEVCNKDLPHGALVAYYRSPLPNVSAVAIAINNTEIIKAEDPEAYSKSGVGYLSPWTAKNIAITDFDRDANGYFVGYLPKVPDLPEQLRQQLMETTKQSPAERYEAGRSYFATLISEMQTNPDQSPIRPGEYPLAVKELIDRTAPERKPPDIAKQPKEKHPWHEGESRMAATWRAWQTTADSLIGKVANVGMILQSLAWETQYCPGEKKASLLQEISSNYETLLKNGKLNDNAYFQEIQGEVKAIAQSRQELAQISDLQERQSYVQSQLDNTYKLLSAIANGANAANLQTAVDSAKSHRGINEEIHQLAQALAYKPHHLRQHQRDASVYLYGKPMPTNTEEPIGWGVEQANQLYQDAKLPELDNLAFRDLIPKCCTPKQEAAAIQLVQQYNSQIKTAVTARERLQQKRPEDEQPTLTIKSSTSEREIVLQRLCSADPESRSPIWRTEGVQADWRIRLERNEKINDWNPEKLTATLIYVDDTGIAQQQKIGYVSPASEAKHQLEKLLGRQNSMTISAPTVKLHSAYVLGQDSDELFAKATQDLQKAIAQIPEEERMAYASALWHRSDGMGIVLRAFTSELCQQLQELPTVELRGIQRPTNEVGKIPDGEYTVRFSEYSYTSDFSQRRNTSPSVAIVLEDGSEKQFGAISNTSVRMPKGSLARVVIETAPSGKTSQMKVLEPLESVAIVPESERYALTIGEAREWYSIASQKDDQALVDRVSVLGNALQYHYNQEQGGGGQDGQLKPPMHYSHPAVTISQAERQQMEGNCRCTETCAMYALSIGEARQWYGIAKLMNDQPLVDRLEALGTALNQHYHQDQGGDHSVKPPADYRHSAVTIPVADQQQIENDISVWQDSIIPKPQPQRRAELAL